MAAIRLDIVPVRSGGWLLADSSRPATPFLTEADALQAAAERLRQERGAFQLFTWHDWQPTLLLERGPTNDLPRPTADVALFGARAGRRGN